VTRREFLARYRDVDAVVVSVLHDAYLRADWNGRTSILAALDKLQAAAGLALFADRRPVA
jgi:hypothetical protein